LWLMENIASIQQCQTIKSQPSSLEINTESIFNVSMQFNNQTTAIIHCNLCQQVPQRTYKFLFENAVVDIDYFAATITIQSKENKQVQTLENFDRNNLFIEQTINFFQNCTAINRSDIAQQQLQTSHQIISICATE
jgi:hypothetical protein